MKRSPSEVSLSRPRLPGIGRGGALALVVAAFGLFVPHTAFAADGDLPPAALIGLLTMGVLFCVGLVVYRRALGLLITSQYGVLLAVYLAHQHREALTGGTSICNISSIINCDAVNTSHYAEIQGVPIAVIGFAFYVAIAYLAFSYLRGTAPRAPAMIMLLSVGAVGYDVFLAYASYHIGSICLFCTTTWAVNLILLVGSTVESKGISPIDAIKDHGGPAVIAGLGGLILGVLAYQGGSSTAVVSPRDGVANTATATPSLDLMTLYEQAAGPVTLDGTEPEKGDPNAPYTFVEWADFQCPHCAAMFPVMEELLAANKDMKLYFKDYPISGNCNKFVEGVRHENACQAAAASECARVQGKFWDLAGQMFGNQEYLGKDDLRFMIGQVGMDEKAFETCMADPATAQSITADVEAGGAAQINGTPSIFLKGPWGDQWVRVIGGKDAINTILAAARTGKPMPPPPPPNPDR